VLLAISNHRDDAVTVLKLADQGQLVARQQIDRKLLTGIP
jgi:hypothetical protein